MRTQHTPGERLEVFLDEQDVVDFDGQGIVIDGGEPESELGRIMLLRIQQRFSTNKNQWEYDSAKPANANVAHGGNVNVYLRPESTFPIDISPENIYGSREKILGKTGIIRVCLEEE